MCSLACESFVFLPVRLGELRECFHNSIMVIISCANTGTHMDRGPEMSLNPMPPSEHNGFVYIDKRLQKGSQLTNRCVHLMTVVNNLLFKKATEMI